MAPTPTSIIESAEASVQQLKEKHFHILVVLMLSMVLAPLVLNYIRVFQEEGPLWEPAIHTLTYLIILASLLPLKSLTFGVRKTALLIGLTNTGVVSVYNSGSFGSGYLFFILSAFVAYYFFERKPALVTIIVVLAIMTAIVLLRTFGVVEIPVENYQSSYGIYAITKIFVAAVVILQVYVLGNSSTDRLKESIVSQIESQEILRRERQATNEYLESIPGLFFLYNQQWELERWNQNTVTVSGFSNEELRGKQFLSFFEIGQQFVVRKSISDTFLKGESYLEGELVKKDGSKVPLALVGKSIDIEGRLCGIGIATDMTEKKLLEKEVQEAQKMEALGILAGGVAHDLNNVLGGILGYAEIMACNLDDGEMPDKDHLDTILSSCDRATGIVKQILMFSRHDEPKKIPLELRTIVRDALKLVRHTIPKSIEITEDLTRDEQLVQADLNQVHQVVMNVCTNAWHAMRDKGGELAISIETIDVGANDIPPRYNAVPGLYQRLVISDTGDGIPADIIETIFVPFYTTKPVGEGTGLGLAVVDKIIRWHEGFLSVDSVVGEGTCFSLFFPVHNQNEILQSRHEPETLPGGSETILIVDDEPQIREASKILLSRLGYTVLTAEDGADGLHKWQTNTETISLVITDFAMPKKNGSKMAEEIRAQMPHLPILLCTGYSETMEAKTIATDHFSATIHKPLRKEKLAHIVRRLLDGEEIDDPEFE